jgi:HemY protein
MMRLFLLFCSFLVVGALSYQLISEDAGYLLVVLGKTSIEMSLWFAIIALLALTFLAWLCITFFRSGFRGVISAKQKVFGYGDEKAQARTVDGLIDFIEENWISAHKKLTRSAGKVKVPLINYLAAARSAYELGDEQDALELLHKAEISNERGGLAVAITQARMQLGNREYEQALASLERASAIRPEHPVVLNLRQQVYVALKDWSALKALLPQLVRHDIGSKEEHHQLELMLYREKLSDCILKNTHLTDDIGLQELNKLWADVPSHIRLEQSLLSTYASQLIAFGEYDTAEKILSHSLEKQWHGQWLDLYGLLLCNDTKKTLANAEQWLKKHEQSPHLLLALGRLCIQNQQWGRAVYFLEKSLSLQTRPDTYAELARVLEHIGETEKSIDCYKQGLLATTTVLSNPAVFSKHN